MPIPTWTPGQVLLAADVNTWFVPIAAVKTADTARASTTTMTADPDLTMTLAANSSYQITGELFYDGAASAADMKCTFIVPASTTGTWHPSRVNPSLQGIYSTPQAWTDTIQNSTTGIGTLQVVGVSGLLITAGSAGTFALSWAQNTSNGTATHMRSGFLVARRIG